MKVPGNISGETLRLLERQPNTRLVKKRKAEQAEKSTSISDDMIHRMMTKSTVKTTSPRSSIKDLKRKGCFIPVISAKCCKERKYVDVKVRSPYLFPSST